MSLRNDLLPVMHDVRGIVDDLGFRTSNLTIITRRWVGGDRPGARARDGFVDSTLTITPRPRIRVVSGEEARNSGGILSIYDVRVDRLTPKFQGGGYTPEELAPHGGTGDANVIVIYRITGPLAGDYALKTASFDRALGYNLVLSNTAHSP